MKERGFRVLGVSLIIFTICGSASQIAHAEVDWAIIKQINLRAKPLDIAASGNGKLIFILTPGEVLFYSISEDKVTNRILIDKHFDRITYSEKNRMLILTSSSSRTLKIIQGERTHEIDLSGLPFKGPADAPVTIAVFDDYQCSHCARLEPFFQQVLDEYPHKVRLVIKHFPLSYHEYSEKAARAALAANVQGKFWEFHNKLFENCEIINDVKIQDIARELKLDMEKFNRDMESTKIKGLVTRDVINGREIGVSGTPTIFINGKLLKRLSVEAFYQLLEAELRKNR